MLFHIILVAVFVVHILGVNLALGGTVLALANQLQSRGGQSQLRTAFAEPLKRANVISIGAAAATGLLLLAVVQSLFRQSPARATLLSSGVWLVVLVLLGLALLAAWKVRPGISLLCLLGIAVVHVGLAVTHARPELWPTLGNPWGVFGDPSYWPRLLHFVLAAIGFTALVVTWWAARQARAGRDVEAHREIARECWIWALVTTALEFADGFILLLTLPQPVLIGLMEGGLATLGPLLLSVIFGLGILTVLQHARDPVASYGLVTGALIAMTLTIVLMSITRHQVRLLSIALVTPW